MELDDLPKERLKELIYAETMRLKDQNDALAQQGSVAGCHGDCFNNNALYFISYT